MIYILTADAKKIAGIVHSNEQAPHRKYIIVSIMESER